MSREFLEVAPGGGSYRVYILDSATDLSDF